METGPAAYELFNQGSPPRGTRERLIYTAIELFYTYGIHAVGLDQIVSTAGLTKTTFYNHFESKDALVAEALQLRDRWENDTFMKAVHAKAGYDPKALLLAGFDVLEEWFSAPEYRGCLFIAAMSEYPLAQDPVHQVAANHYLAVGRTVSEIAKAAGVRDHEGLAREWISLLIGATSHHLACPEHRPASVARRIAEARLADYLAEVDAPA
jgi:AcrR family transcriptional regulator